MASGSGSTHGKGRSANLRDNSRDGGGRAPSAAAQRAAVARNSAQFAPAPF